MCQPWLSVHTGRGLKLAGFSAPRPGRGLTPAGQCSGGGRRMLPVVGCGVSGCRRSSPPRSRSPPSSRRTAGSSAVGCLCPGQAAPWDAHGHRVKPAAGAHTDVPGRGAPEPLRRLSAPLQPLAPQANISPMLTTNRTPAGLNRPDQPTHDVTL